LKHLVTDWYYTCFGQLKEPMLIYSNVWDDVNHLAA